MALSPSCNRYPTPAFNRLGPQSTTIWPNWIDAQSNLYHRRPSTSARFRTALGRRVYERQQVTAAHRPAPARKHHHPHWQRTTSSLCPVEQRAHLDQRIPPQALLKPQPTTRQARHSSQATTRSSSSKVDAPAESLSVQVTKDPDPRAYPPLHRPGRRTRRHIPAASGTRQHGTHLTCGSSGDR